MASSFALDDVSFSNCCLRNYSTSNSAAIPSSLEHFRPCPMQITLVRWHRSRGHLVKKSNKTTSMTQATTKIRNWLLVSRRYGQAPILYLLSRALWSSFVPHTRLLPQTDIAHEKCLCKCVTRTDWM